LGRFRKSSYLTKIIFDSQFQVVEEIFNFIETTLEAGESVLILSKNGNNRSCTIAVAYLMKR